MLTLTPHQQAAIDATVQAFTTDGKALFAIRGYAGSGKTTLIPHLRTALRDAGIPVLVGSPTHRAAMILRSKGLTDASTVHSHALTPYFKPEYAACVRYLGAECPTHDPLPLVEGDQELDEIFGPGFSLPPLLADAMTKRQVSERELLRRATSYPAKRVLESVGLHGRDYFAGFGAKEGNGCLIVDEASMVGADTLALCQQAFPLVCLIGDPGQLPPVKERGILSEVPGIDLTEVHRQAADSPIIQLATLARAGTIDWQALPLKAGELDEWLGVAAAEFLTAPLIVWRNKTRLQCTAAIRDVLGYPPDRLVPGEPLVCRATNEEDRADGFINNTLWRVIDVSATDPTTVTVQEEGHEANTHTIKVHIEELHGEAIHPRAIPFRFGYCLTSHNAQGGEWPTVYIAKPDLRAQGGFAKRSALPSDQAAGPQWAYTAITRAKQTLGFLTAYDFTAMRPAQALGELCMPTMMVVSETVGPEKQESFLTEGQPTTPPTDDLPGDPPQPMQSIADQTKGRLESPGVNPNTVEGQAILRVDEAMFKVSSHAAHCLTAMEESVRGTLKHLDMGWEAALRVLNHNNQAITCLKEALQTWSPHTPYAATMQVVTPEGYPMSVTIEALTEAEFLQKVGGMILFLQSNAFKAQQTFAA